MKLFTHVRLTLCLAGLAIVQDSTGQETMELVFGTVLLAGLPLLIGLPLFRVGLKRYFA